MPRQILIRAVSADTKNIWTKMDRRSAVEQVKRLDSAAIASERKNKNFFVPFIKKSVANCQSAKLSLLKSEKSQRKVPACMGLH
jgi:hypothetical protein